VLLVYRIMFGMVRLNTNEFCTFRNQPQLRGHKYVINKQRCSNNSRNNFLATESLNYGIVYHLVQQILLVSTSLTSHFITIIFYCTVNWILRKIVNCLGTITFIMYVCMYTWFYIYCIHCRYPVHYNYCILMRLVSGLLVLCCLINWIEKLNWIYKPTIKLPSVVSLGRAYDRGRASLWAKFNTATLSVAVRGRLAAAAAA